MEDGHNLLYRSATGLEKAGADVDGERITGINAELIIDTWNPYKTFLKNLPFLAWAWDVDLWEDGWSEQTRREWTARQWEFKSKRGTIAGIEMALDFAGRDVVGVGGYEIRQALTPPQAFFASPNLTPEQYNAWLRLMPEVRIYFGEERGQMGIGFYSDNGFADPDDTATISVAEYDHGPELYGRKAILRQFGKPDQPLKLIRHEIVVRDVATIDWEEVRTPGLSTGGFFAGDCADDKFVDVAEVEPTLRMVRFDRTQEHSATETFLSIVAPTQEPIYVTSERNSDIGQAHDFAYSADSFANLTFVGEDLAPLMLADRLYLLDENIAVPMSQAWSFADNDRVGFPKYTMELLIDLKTVDRSDNWFSDQTFVGLFGGMAGALDLQHIERARRAVVAGKSLRDKAGLQFDVLREIDATDKIADATTAGDWVQNHL